ncbi:MAG TPA: STAS domain-containing protein [Acidimicrobiia bacterium]|nr:STAS domain-containing protein [Acidimicrobiia bacterium]
MGNNELLTMEVEETENGITILTLVGEIDLESGPALADEFRKLAGRKPKRVIVDASGVTFMDSTGIHTLVEGKRALHDAGTSLVLVSSRIVRRVLELVFPTPMFAIRVDTLEEALATLESETR